MEYNRKSMILGVIITLLCVAVGVICLALNANTFAWIMFAVILALAIFQAVSFWYFAKALRKEEGENNAEIKANKENADRN